MTVCPRCGAPLHVGASFCTGCGATLVPPSPAAPAVSRPPKPVVPVDEVSTSAGVAVVAVVVALLVIGVGAFGISALRPARHGLAAVAAAPAPTATGTPPILTPGGKQANLLAQFLRESAAARVTITPGIHDASHCMALGSDAAIFKHASDVRRRLAGQLSSVDWNTLPSGTSLHSELQIAFTASAAADTDYQAWALSLRRGHCHAHSSTGGAAYARALRDDRHASAAKKAFARDWNPVAASYGLPNEIWFEI